MYPKGGQGLVVWQGLGETEIDCVSGDAHMHMEKVVCGLSKTSREERNEWGVGQGTPFDYCPRPATFRGGPVPESGLLIFQAEIINLQIAPDGIELAYPCA